MAQVKVTLMAVVGNKYLAVLEGAHGARIHIQIRVHLLHGYFISARFEQMTQRCCRNALAQGRNNAASYKDMLCHDSPSMNPTPENKKALEGTKLLSNAFLY